MASTSPKGERKTRAPRRSEPLSRDVIVEEAIALVDEVGLRGLTIRALAARLDVAAMSIYEYFESKDRLERALAEWVTSRAVPSEDLRTQAPPSERIRWAATQARAQLLEHPSLVPLVIRHPQPRRTEGGQALFDVGRIAGVALDDGWPPDEVPLLMAVLTQFTLGFVLYETGRLPNGPYEQSAELVRTAVERRGAQADTLEYQALAAFLPERADEVFEAGFDALYRGMRPVNGR